MNIEYSVRLWSEGTQYIAHAMPIDVASSGETPDNARAAVGEAVDLFLSTASDCGNLQIVLKQAGYENRAGEWYLNR